MAFRASLQSLLFPLVRRPPTPVQISTTTTTARSHWAEVVRITRAPPGSKMKIINKDDETIVIDKMVTYEDPSFAAHRLVCAEDMDNQRLKHKRKEERHEKQWMKRRRLKIEREYQVKKKGVIELKMYIQFKKELEESNAALTNIPNEGKDG